MWASIDTDNNVTKVYTRPTAITYGDVNYPQNVMSSWSNDELATILGLSSCRRLNQLRRP
jgi:hypothetical protein